MKIIILCKRRPQNKDLWSRPYGRFYNLAKQLAILGHTINFVLLNYQREEEFIEYRDGMTWHSVNLLPNPLHVYAYTLALAQKNKADWIIGFSDTYFGILAVLIAKQLNIKSLVDAYDNYESYMPWNKPLHFLWRYVLRQADGISAPGSYLLDKMSIGRDAKKLQCILPMAADDHFYPLPKNEARATFNLPENKKLIGYCGSAHASRDMEVFFRAIEILAKKHSDYVFIMTGYIDDKTKLPSSVRHLGYIADELMPKIVSSLDVIISGCPDSTFGNYSYPVKIYEALACNTLVIASENHSIAEILQEDSNRLFPIGDHEILAAKIENALSSNNIPAHLPKQKWQEIALKLQDCLINAH